MSRKNILLASVIGLTLASSMALAGPGKHCRGEPPLDAMDLDKNGEISADEIKQFQSAHFKEADSNQDGSIDFQEMQAARERQHLMRQQEHFDALDLDNNGKLTAQETSEKFDQHLKKCDANADGNLSADEIGGCGGRGHRHGKPPHRE